MPRRPSLATLVLLGALPAALPAQGRFPPDSLVNLKVLPRTTPVRELVDQMRGYTTALGVRCTFCHVGEEGQPLASYDFASDDKRPKLVAREMMRMVQEVNRRLGELPGRASPGLDVTCSTCHRGVSRPIPLAELLVQVATAGGADSAVRSYRALRERYYGRAAYDFGEGSLNQAAARLVAAGRGAEAVALARLNVEVFPEAAGPLVGLGDALLATRDSAGAVANYRAALQKNPREQGALQRLRQLGQQP